MTELPALVGVVLSSSPPSDVVVKASSPEDCSNIKEGGVKIKNEKIWVLFPSIIYPIRPKFEFQNISDSC